MRAAGKLFSRSALVLGLRLSGAAIIFAVHALIARWLGAGSLGQFAQVTAATNIIATILPLGFQVIASYFAVEYATRGQGGLLSRFLTQAYGQAAVMAVAVFAGGSLLLPYLGSETIATHWAPICIIAFALSNMFVSGALLAALKRPIAAFAGDALLRPLIIAAAFGAAVMMAANVISCMLWIMAFSLLMVAAVYVWVARRSASGIAGAGQGGSAEHRRWWRFALPWTLIALTADYFFDLDIILLSGHLAYSDLAIFGVMARIFSLAAFGVAAVYTISLPDVFEAEARNDRAGFQASVLRTNQVAAAVAAMLLLGVALAAPWFLDLFGPGFSAGAWPLVILCAALLVRCVFGPAALILSIHDHPYAALPAVALGIAGLAGANMLLVPALGLTGAAFSAVFAITLWSVAMWYTALRITGIDVSIFAPLFSAGRRTSAA